MAIYLWHDHYWIIGAVDHNSNAEAKAASAPVGALYMAPAGSPPTHLPPVYGWTDGAPYVISRQNAQSSFNSYIQAFGCSLLVAFALCHVVVQRRAAAQDVAQHQRRLDLVEMAELRRTGRLAMREREMAEEAANAEAWEASWLYPFWHMAEEATGIPKLVQVVHPGDAQFELGVVLLEKNSLAGEPLVLQCDSGDGEAGDDAEQTVHRAGDNDGQLSSADQCEGVGASTVSTTGVATCDKIVDNPLHAAAPADDSPDGVDSV